ncbi:hypothetical protein [Amycolatopsis thermophila]|uniref:Uncharacterized protein n=1 Tax=Amycolatopsis thermophila TaxID=206084 RepID=A0ABU0ENL2_9PSEU|nr:hypothetical protein [Amycolatopsis thermophila]MDQ0376832.1 hypothetical protein [Amycolatopsis thermophila]
MIPPTRYGTTFSVRFQAWARPVWIAPIGLALGRATAPGAGHHMTQPATSRPPG